MNHWLDGLLAPNDGPPSDSADHQQRKRHACVLVTVMQTRGSCPRDSGTRMIVWKGSSHGTIGGGHLEYQAIQICRELLHDARPAFRIERFALAARSGQCCGGVVNLTFEYIPARRPQWLSNLNTLRRAGEAVLMVTSIDSTPHRLLVTQQECLGTLPDACQHQIANSRARELLGDGHQAVFLLEDNMLYESVALYESVVDLPLHVTIFGAGHVGKALVSVLSPLPCQILWIDSRAHEFPERVPTNVLVENADQPEDEVSELPTGSHVVIMTHSHALDQAICERALRRDDLAWCGLIGSITKRRQFKTRLLAKGLSEDRLDRLCCPIGIAGISGKHPSEIAIAVAAQVLLFAHKKEPAADLNHEAA